MKFPSKIEQRTIFYRSFGNFFANAIGAIDCTHHPIQRPKINQRSFYCNDKKCHSLLTQMVVGASGAILHIEAGYPGKLKN